MRMFTLLIFFALAVFSLTVTAPAAHAQVAVEVGPPPDCPYGYYDVAPYDCAPAGYYGPEWFTDGVFIGVGPWFHGATGFHGMVDNHFHRDHGYTGPFPAKGEKAEPSRRVTAQTFHGNEMRDGRGHVVKR